MTKNYLSEKITSIVLGPGCGEYVYELIPISDDGYPINVHKVGKNPKLDKIAKLTDMSKTIEFLKSDYPSLQNISIIVGWFGTSTDAGKISIKPAVESKKGPAWEVADFNRNNAYEISKDADNSPMWGGTPTDRSIFDVSKKLHELGYNVTMYPMLFIDDQAKSWRGFIKAKSDADINHFFSEYSKFVKHYASMERNDEKLADYIDDFIIGTEMMGITEYKNSKGEYKGVDGFINLTAEIRQIVGSDIKLTYAANWDEYHHSEDGSYYLDKLWVDENIDYIGIDAYFQLTDNLKQSDIRIEDIMNGWESGLGYDYDRKKGITKLLTPEVAIKNLKWWWSNEHKNPDGKFTEWQPKMKPIVFTEVGFSSIDGISNNPWRYYEPHTKTGDIPDNSDGKADLMAQFKAIYATEKYWNELHSQFPEYEELSLRRDYYKIDARFGYELSDYSDAEYYHYSHDLKITDFTPPIESELI